MAYHGLTEELAFMRSKKWLLECNQLTVCWCCTNPCLLFAGRLNVVGWRLKFSV